MNTHTTLGHFTPITKMRVESLLVGYHTKSVLTNINIGDIESIHLSVGIKLGISRKREMTINDTCTIRGLIDVMMASAYDSFSIAAEAINSKNDRQLIAGGFAIRFCNNGAWVTADVPGIN